MQDHSSNIFFPQYTTSPVIHTINCFIVIQERFHCIQHPRGHLVNLKHFSFSEFFPRSSHLVEYENVVLTCRTIAYDPGAQLVFVVCRICLGMKKKLMNNFPNKNRWRDLIWEVQGGYEEVNKLAGKPAHIKAVRNELQKPNNIKCDINSNKEFESLDNT